MLSTASSAPGQQPFGGNTGPANSYNSFLDRPSHHRRHKDASRHQANRASRDNALLEQANREAATARSEAERSSRNSARSYLEEFLQTSEWQDHVDQISIIEEALPTMEELEGYGELDETVGTKACRKLFKAVVVWEQVGHSLWEKLRDEAQKCDRLHKPTRIDAAGSQTKDDQETRQSSQYRPEGSHHDIHGLPIIPEQPPIEPLQPRRSSLSSLASSVSRGRKPSLSNLINPSPSSSRRPRVGLRRRSSSLPASRKPIHEEQHGECNCCEGGEHEDGPRRATDPGPRRQGEWSPNEGESDDGPDIRPVGRAATFPKKVSKTCANAVRRTFGALHDPRGRHREQRRASVGG